MTIDINAGPAVVVTTYAAGPASVAVAGVQSVAGRTGIVALVEADIANLVADLAAKATTAAVTAADTLISDRQLVKSARVLDTIIVGTITRDANQAATSAPVVWADGTVGTYTATTVSTAFPGAVDAYTVTYGSPVTRTYTQPAVTRNAAGAVTNLPAIVVT